MNIFYVDKNPKTAAKMMCDKHIIKMILESAQMLCTAKRVLDGKLYMAKTKNGRNIKRWRLSDERENVLYKASHINHPSAIWVRESVENYLQMYKLLLSLICQFLTSQ